MNLEDALPTELDKQTTFIWWDMWCQNQHIVGDVADTFSRSVKQAKRFFFSVPNMTNPKALGRVWCQFEIACALKAQRERESGGLRFEFLTLSEQEALGLSCPPQFDVSSAEASRPEDKVMLLQFIDSMPGGRDGVNQALSGMFVSLFRGQQLRDAAQGGDKKTVQVLLEEGLVDVNAATYGGCTALHRACTAGDADMLELLLKHKAAVNALDKFGNTCLHIAVIEFHEHLVHLLMANGAKCDIADVNGVSALEMAKMLGMTNFVKLMESKNKV